MHKVKEEDGVCYALKTFKKDFGQKAVEKEVLALKATANGLHPNIDVFLRCFNGPLSTCLLFELCSGMIINSFYVLHGIHL